MATASIRRFKIISLLIILASSVLYAAEQKSILYTAFGGSYEPDPRMERYAVGIWHNHPEIIPVMRRAKEQMPQLKTFMYRELFCVLETETLHNESVGGYENLPDAWFQKDIHGKRIEVSDYPGRWVMDVGNPEWQDYWIRKTLNDVKENGWDGVFADDALTSIKAHDMPPLANYRTDAEYQEAFTKFLTEITHAFHIENKLVIANASNTYEYPGLWEKWLDITDGLAEEHFAGEGWAWGDKIAQRQMEAFKLADDRGKFALAMTYRAIDDEKTAHNSLAAFRIIAGPKSFWSSRPYDTAGMGPFEEDQKSWDLFIRYPLGEPLEKAKTDGKIWTRLFENGFAAVNTSASPAKVLTPSGDIKLNGREGRIILNSNSLPPALHQASDGLKS